MSISYMIEKQYFVVYTKCIMNLENYTLITRTHYKKKLFGLLFHAIHR